MLVVRKFFLGVVIGDVADLGQDLDGLLWELSLLVDVPVGFTKVTGETETDLLGKVDGVDLADRVSGDGLGFDHLFLLFELNFT